MENVVPRVEVSPDEPSPLRLSRMQFWTSWAIAVALFLFITGPIWLHASDIDRVDRAIFLSYLPIPFLVAACLAWSRRLSWRSFLLNTLELTLVKYTATFALALVLWEWRSPPSTPAASPPHVHAPAEAVEPAVVPTPIDPAKTGAVTATVVDEGGKPVQGAVVFVAGGLEDFVFARSAAPIRVENDGRGVVPGLFVAEVGQVIEARSSDGHLHTLIATKGGGVVFNVPLLSSGDTTAVRAHDALGVTTIRCNVHPSSQEREARMIVVAHPYHATTDDRGQARIAGIPAGPLRFAAATHTAVSREQSTTLASGSQAQLAITLAP